VDKNFKTYRKMTAGQYKLISYSRSIKYYAKNCLAMIWSICKIENKNRVKIPILCYHSVNNSYNDEVDPINSEMFDKHLEFLASNYNVITLHEALKHIKVGYCDVDNPVVLTFDDGYIDNFEIAFPMLKKYKIPATIFVVTNFLNKSIDLVDDPAFGPLDWKQLVEMQSSGLISIGAHTVSHNILSGLTLSQAEQEIVESKAAIQNHINLSVDLFAYPNGQLSDFQRDLGNTLVQNKFICACSTMWRTTHKVSECWRLNRVMITGSDDLSVLSAKVSGHFDYIYFIHLARHYFKKLILAKKFINV